MSHRLAGTAAALLLLAGWALAQPAPDAPKTEPAKQDTPAKAPPADKPGEKPAVKPDEKPVEKPAAKKPSPDELMRFKYARGDVLTYRIKTDLVQVQTIGQAKRDMSLSRDDLVASTVTELDEKGFAHVQQKFLRLSAKGRFDGADYVFDSKATPAADVKYAKVLTPFFERLAGGEVQYLLGPQGEVAEVRGYAELLRDLLVGNPLATQCAGGGTNNAARVAAEEQTVIFGDKVVKPGEKWEVPLDQESPALGRARGRRVYTLVGSEKLGARNVLRINISTELVFDLNLDRDGVRLTGRMSTYESNGVALFDKQAGRLVSLKVAYKMSGKLTAVVKETTTEIDNDQSHTVTVDLMEKP